MVFDGYVQGFFGFLRHSLDGWFVYVIFGRINETLLSKVNGVGAKPTKLNKAGAHYE
jgi:hypothetical protein